MDLFSANRTFLVIFGLVIIFTLFLFHYFQPQFSEPFVSDIHYPIDWKYEIPVFIKGKYTSEESERYNLEKTVFDTNIHSKSDCHKQCLQQTECVHKGNDWLNKCEPSYVENNCYCPFQKVSTESKEGFENVGVSVRNKDDTNMLTLYKKLLDDLPNQPISSWRYNLTNNTWNSLSYKPNVVSWKKLKIPDINNMAFSFWVYFKEVENQKRTEPIDFFRIASKQNVHLRLFAERERPILKFMVNGSLLETRNTPYTQKSYTHDPDMDNGNEIGYNHKATFVIVSITNSVIHLYLNGVWKNNMGGDTIYPPSDDESKLSIGLSSMRKPKGVYWKDFRFYDHSIDNLHASLLYKNPDFQKEGYLDNSIIFPEIESFQSMNVSDTNIIPSSLKEWVGSYFKKQEGFENSGNAIILGKNGIHMNQLALRSETNKTCNRDHKSKERANYQKSPNHNTVEIHKATIHIPSSNREIDMTREIQNLLRLQPDRINTEYKLGAENHKITIEVMHPWSREIKTMNVNYTTTPAFDWQKVVKQVKCLNSDDTVWDAKDQLCKDIANSKACGETNPTCIHYTYFIRDGKCSANTPPGVFGNKQKQTTIEMNKGKTRMLSFVELDANKNEYLEMIFTNEEAEKEILFSPNGTTIMMWVKVNPEKRQSSRNECRLLNMGNRNWRILDDEVAISIDGNVSKDNIVLRVGTHEDKSMGSQILDNQWHHIVWVLMPTNVEKEQKNTWKLYNNGVKLGEVHAPYPENKIRGSKMVGGSAVDWDEQWGPSIGEFHIHNGILSDEIIRNVYLYGIQ